MKLLKSEVETPILILGFNRPEDMRRLIEALRLIKPMRIYFAVDGPRNHIEGEKERVLATQNLIKEFNWPSKIESRFLDTNAGCKIAISSAINWFFEKEDVIQFDNN